MSLTEIQPTTEDKPSHSESEKATRNHSSARQEKARNNDIHIVTQGKGGVGKSTCAALLAQYLAEKGEVRAFDLDPVQSSFTKFKAIGAEVVEVTDGELSNVDALDELLDQLCDATVPCVLDVGAGSYVNVNNWILRDDVIGILRGVGKRVVFHVIIAGGKELVETTIGLRDMIDTLGDDVKFVAWLNPHSGALSHNGTSFLESPFYNDYGKRIANVVTLPTLDANYEKPSFSRLLEASLTFAEARASDMRRAEKARLLNIWTRISPQIEAATRT